VTLDHEGHPAERALDALGIQSDGRNGSDGAGGHAIPVVEPENRSIPGEVVAWEEPAERFVDLAQRDLVFHRAGIRAARWRRVDADLLGERFSQGNVAFLSALEFEVIADDAGGHRLQKSEDGVLMLRLEATKYKAVVSTQLQEAVLNEIVEEMRLRQGPAACGSQHDLGNDRAETANEFCPGRFVIRTDAGSQQIFGRERRVAGHQGPNPVGGGFYSNFVKMLQRSAEAPAGLSQQSGRHLGVVSEDDAGAGAPDTQESFHQHALVIDPIVPGSGLDHGVFAGDLVGG